MEFIKTYYGVNMETKSGQIVVEGHIHLSN